MIPAKAGHVLKQQIRLSHLTYIYDAAHAIEVDQPERLLRLVKAFLERGEAYIVNFGDEAASMVDPEFDAVRPIASKRKQ